MTLVLGWRRLERALVSEVLRSLWEYSPFPRVAADASSSLSWSFLRWFFSVDDKERCQSLVLPPQLLHTWILPAGNFSDRLRAKSFAGMNDSKGEGTGLGFVLYPRPSSEERRTDGLPCSLCPKPLLR